jgi:hypothetical protein
MRIHRLIALAAGGLQSFESNLDASAPVADQALIPQFHIPDHVRAAGTPELPGKYPSASRWRPWMPVTRTEIHAALDLYIDLVADLRRLIAAHDANPDVAIALMCAAFEVFSANSGPDTWDEMHRFIEAMRANPTPRQRQLTSALH